MILNSLYLIAKYISTAVKENVSVKLEYQRLEMESGLLTLNKFIVTLLNAWSLKNHFYDIRSEKYRLTADVLSLTATQANVHEDLNFMLPHLMVYLTLSLVLVLANTVVLLFVIKGESPFSIIINLMILPLFKFQSQNLM